MTRTLSTGTPSVDARPCCWKCDFCVPDQQVTCPSLISTSAQAGPMLACDWNGHSYSASITFAALLNASSTLPFSFSIWRLRTLRLADVVVKRSLLGEWRINLRPLHLQFLRRLNGIPFLVGNDAEEALVPHHFGAGNVLDRAFVHLHRHAAGHRGTDHAPMHHARHLHIGDEVLLGEDLWRHVLALDRLADDFVLARLFRLCLAGRIERRCRISCSSRAER